MKKEPFVSVVIPVFNDLQRLETCLQAIEEQTYPKSLYEVIVVDNGSVEDVKVLVNRFAQVSLTREAQPGSYAARNKGISVAKGEVIAFTDSDCIPASDWLEAGVKHLLSVPKHGLVGGKIEMFFKDPNYPTAVEIYDGMKFFQQQGNIEERKYSATANLFTFKSVFEDIGVFNSELKSGGDVEWGKRAFNLGYLITYADDCHVAHPARHSLAELCKKVARVKGGHYKIRNKDAKYSLMQLITDLPRFKPPLRSILRSISSNKQIKNTIQMVQVFFIALLVHYIRLLELKRLQLGGTPRR